MRNGVSSPWANSLRLGLIGNPENRRIQDFQAAVRALGGPCPPCLSYSELLRDPLALARFDVDLLRVDSPGENAGVAAALIARGGGPERPELSLGQIAHLHEYHLGFCDMLQEIGRAGIPCLNAPADISVMFDKWDCHQRFLDQGVARPESELAPTDAATLLEEICRQSHGQLFLKPLHGSSASGVCALRWNSGRHQLIAPLRIQTQQGQATLVNSLDVRTYDSLGDIADILGILLPQGMIRERWIPKLSLPGGVVDLRVLVIDGEARHWVIRQGRHPMTNLHLGNRRGDDAALRDVIGEAKLAEAFALAERAAACFPESLYAGVDVLVDTRHRLFVGEINAFGDLLPRLMHRGDSAYTAIAKACLSGRFLEQRRMASGVQSGGAG